ncbi:hypothetical protein B7494_g4251 [Chlorociboria aeruginascens]|nr:hypothetical protein B7494_g4251 [Chlorociboria aeruginascens]
MRSAICYTLGVHPFTWRITVSSSSSPLLAFEVMVKGDAVASSSRPAASSTQSNQLPQASTPQTPSTVITPPSSIFSQSQYALSLSLIKSKPAGLTTREYCASLQKNFNSGRPPVRNRYCDSAEFWKDQFERICKEKKELEEKIGLLESERTGSHRILLEDREELEVGESFDRTPRASSNARKRLAEPHDPSDEDENQESEDPRSNVQGRCQKMRGYIYRIARKRFTIENTLKLPRSSTIADDILRYTNQLITLLETALSDCCWLLISLTTKHDSQSIRLLRKLMHSISLSFQSCTSALEDFCRNILGRESRHGLVSRLALFYNHALSLLHELSNILSVDEIASGENHRPRHTAKRAKVEGGEFAVFKYLTKALTSIFEDIDWKIDRSEHIEVLEGILYSVLNRTGKLLSEAIFDEELATSKRPATIRDPESPLRNSEAMKLESRYLMQILHAALGGQPQKEIIAHVLANTSAVKGKGSGVQTLLEPAMNRLQQTLLKGTLGVDGDAAKFLDALKLPEPAEEEEVLDMENGHEQFGREWLIEQVWELVGWDTI